MYDIVCNQSRGFEIRFMGKYAFNKKHSFRYLDIAVLDLS